MEIKVDVLDYLGIHEDGVLSILSLNIDDNHYECVFYYGESMIALTPDPKLEEKLGVHIEDWEFYNDVVIEIKLGRLKAYVDYFFLEFFSKSIQSSKVSDSISVSFGRRIFLLPAFK